MTKIEDMSEPERQSWLTLLADGAVFIYFWQAMTQGFGVSVQSFTPSEVGRIFLWLVILTIVLHSVISAIFELRKRRESFEKDERDLRIAAFGNRVGYRGLQIGLGVLIVTLLLQYTIGATFRSPIPLRHPVEILFALCVLSYIVDLVKQAVLIYHYRQN